MEDRAAVRRVLGRRLAAVRLRDLADDREPEARARQVARVGGPVEAVEDVGEILVRRSRGRGRAPSPPSPPPRRPPSRSTSPRCRAGSRRPGRAGSVTPRTTDSERFARNATRGVRTRARPIAAETSSSRRTSSTSCGLRAVDLDEVADEGRELLDLADHVGEELLALLLGQRLSAHEHLDVRAEARERRPQLVRRVGDELALRAHRLVERRRASALNAVARRPSSSRELVSIRRERSRVAATSSATSVSWPTGRSAAAPTSMPRAPAMTDATDADDQEVGAEAAERVVDLVQRPRHLRGEAVRDLLARTRGRAATGCRRRRS